MCKSFDVSRSGFYSWQGRPKSQRALNYEALLVEIKAIHNEKNKDNYGSPRVYKELKKKGILCSEKMVAKVMKESGIQARTTKKFKVTTDSNHSQPVAENVLNREFDKATKANQLWVSDITYIWTLEGWLYLTCVIDLYSRKVVGWSMSSSMTKEFVMEALHMAIKQRCLSKDQRDDLLHHSDRGSQYCSNDYQDMLEANGITCSMSRKGNCWDNAAMESFFATLKKELVHQERYKTRAAARRSIFEYIEVFYNRERIHSSLGYISPEKFERLA